MNFKKYFIFALLLGFVYTNSAEASPLSKMPDYIPLEDEEHIFRPPATDLTYNKEILSIQEVKQGELQGFWDIFELEPRSSQIWQNRGFISPPALSVRETGESFTYLKAVDPSPPDFHQLSVKQFQPNGSEKIFTIFLGKKVHSILLRMAILRKLGYSVPPIAYLKSFRVNFGRNRFILADYIGTKVPQDTLGTPNRWIKNIEQGNTENISTGETTTYWKVKEDATYLEMQDGIIMAQSSQYNLAIGMNVSRIDRGRRIFRSLKVPYALTDVPESVNLFSWNLGKTVDGHLHLPYSIARNGLKPDLADVHWMALRVAKLTRKDFEEIVQAAHLPEEVSTVLVEKIISRRNDLIKKLELQSFVKQKVIPFSPKISLGKNLKNGKLMQENWEGYGSRFAFGDPESPLSKSEIRAYFTSEVISNALSALMLEINETLLPPANVLAKGQESFNNKFFDTLIESIKTGEAKEIPFSTWSTPYYSANIIASRNIVVGQYLGTNNRIQLADSIGVALEAGVFMGAYGDLPKNMSLSAGANGFYSKVYTHLTPVTSVKQAMKSPFKNLFVPMVKDKYAEIFDDLLDGNFDEVEDEEKQKKIKKAMSLFHKNMKSGESFIISDRFGAYARLNPSYSPGNLLRIYAEVRATETIISRLHIYKESKNSIHIYDDTGNALKFSFGFGIKALDVSILQFNVRKMPYGTASIDHYKLNIEPEMKKNKKVMENIHALRAILFNGSLELLRTWQNPWKIRHKVSETVSSFNFLYFTSKKLRNQALIDVERPNGQKGKIIRANMGGRVGKDPSTMAINALSSILNKWLKSDISLKIQNNGDPGNTLYGSSQTHTSVLEAIVNEEHSGKNFLENPYVRLEHRWRGWETDKKDILKRIKNINKQFSYDVFDLKRFNDVENIQLYSFVVNVNLYEKSILNIMNMPKKDLRRLFKKHGKCWNSVQYDCRITNPAADMITRRVNPLRKLQYMKAKYQRSVKSGDAEAAANYALKTIDFLSGHTNLDGLAAFAGGMENIYVQPRITGFREGDESAYESILGNSRGRVSSKMVQGPSNFLLQASKMSHGEFFALWLLEFL